MCGLVVRSAVGLGRRTIPLEGGKDAVVFLSSADVCGAWRIGLAAACVVCVYLSLFSCECFVCMYFIHVLNIMCEVAD